MTVERLDFSNLPPGYSKRLHRTGWSLYHDGKELGFYQARSAIADLTKDAWAHYKARHDPPGMEVHGNAFYIGDSFYEVDGSEEEARAAAWAWYERRAVLVGAYEKHERARSWPSHPVIPWPEALAWSDDVVDQAEGWLSGTADLPEVLRG